MVPQQSGYTEPSWNDPEPPAAPSYQQPANTGQQDSLQPQESYEDWDDEWDDDDSSTTTENPVSYMAILILSETFRVLEFVHVSY